MKKFLSHTSQRAADERGAAMLEAAIALPFLLLVMFAIFELGLAFARAQILTNAAREGAREASLFRSNCEPGQTTKDAGDAVRRYAGGRLGMPDAQLRIAVKDVCLKDGQVKVTVEYTHKLPVLAGLTRLVGANSSAAQINLSASAQMRNENI